MDAGGGGGGGGTTTIALASFRQELSSTLCENLFRCSNNREQGQARLYFGDLASCTRALARLSNLDLEDLARGVSTGRLRYDPAAARRCLDGFRATCSLELEIGEVCAGVFVGSVPRGGQCFRDEDCAGDSFCVAGSTGCPGTCNPRAPLGASCDHDPDCTRASGPSRCFQATSPGTTNRCVQVVGGPAAAAGQPCGAIPQGATRVIETPCAPGLSCQTGIDGSEGTCRLAIAEGQARRSSDVCAPGMVCMGGACTRITVRMAAGEACSVGGFPEVCSPFANLRCEAGRCVSIGNGTLGSSCQSGDIYDLIGCNTGLYCERSTQRCTTRNPPGSRCERGAQCSTGECRSGVCSDRICRLGSSSGGSSGSGGSGGGGGTP